MFRFVYTLFTLVFLLLLSFEGMTSTLPRKTAETRSIPLAELGARVEKEQPSPIPVMVGNVARLAAPLQAIEAEVGPEGLRVDSTSSSEGQGQFQLTPRNVSKGFGVNPLGDGVVSVRDQSVRLDRGALTEIFSASAEGIRQDFMVHHPPQGPWPLSLSLEVTGATVTQEGVNVALTLPAGRKLVYHGLKVTDAAGKVLSARMVRLDEKTVAINVQDQGARYPVMIDPTITDADWQVLNQGIPGACGAITAAVYRLGSLYVGGNFTCVGNTLANHIAQWNGSAWSPLGSGVNGTVNALAVSGSTTLYVGGNFTNAGGSSANHIAQWDIIHSTWSALGSGVNNGVDGTVNALAVSGSTLYAGGVFTNAGGSSANHIAKWDIIHGTWSALRSGINNAVNALVVSGSTLYVGGNFTNADGSSANYIAQWNGSAWSALGSGVNGTVNALAVLDSSSIYVGGQFTTADGNPANNIAQWQCTPTCAGSALGSSGSYGVNNAVNALAVSGSTLYAGGQFTTAGGNSVNYIAQWNGSVWSALGSGMNNWVNALAVSGSTLYAGGSFTTADGNPANHIAKWNLNCGSYSCTWSALGSGGNNGVDNDVSALAVSSNGTLYAGGQFTNAGGSSANYIAQWDGSAWSALGSGVDNAVNALAVSGSTTLYVGGNFTNAGGSSANHIAQWDGSAWSALGSGVDNTVNALAVLGSTLYAGGRFLYAGGSTVYFIAQWDGSGWSALGSGMNTWVSALAVSGSTLYAGGYFTTAGGNPANYIAQWNCTNSCTWSALGSGVDNDVSALAVSGYTLYVGGVFASAGGNYSPYVASVVSNPTLSPLTQTVNATAGTPITPTMAFTATNFVGTVSYAVLPSFPNVPNGLSLDPTTGIISGTPTNQSSVTYTVTATGSTSGSATATVVITVSAGSASQLVFTTSPQTTPAGTSSGTITVQLQDAYGNPVNAGAGGVPVTLSSNSVGSATFSPVPLTITSGSSSASFTYTDTAAGTPTLTAASTGLTSANQQETVTVGTASQLGITTQPVGGTSGSALATQPVIAVRDANGNTVTGSTASVTVTIGSGSGGTLGGTTTVSAVNGVANFSDLTLSGTAGTHYVLHFASGSLAAADSNAVIVSPAPVDCVVSDWGPYGACSASCGGGTQTRTRTITTPASNGGAACPALSQSQACNVQACQSQASGTAPGGSGPVNATIGAGGSFISTQFTTPNNPPAGQSFPYGVFGFTATTTQPSVTITLTYPQALPAGTKVWKNINGTWLDWTNSVTISGNTISYAITDGGAGDADGAVNGSITDPMGPADPATAIPLFSEWAQLLLGLMVMMLIGWHFHRERSY